MEGFGCIKVHQISMCNRILTLVYPLRKLNHVAVVISLTHSFQISQHGLRTRNSVRVNNDRNAFAILQVDFCEFGGTVEQDDFTRFTLSNITSTLKSLKDFRFA